MDDFFRFVIESLGEKAVQTSAALGLTAALASLTAAWGLRQKSSLEFPLKDGNYRCEYQLVSQASLVRVVEGIKVERVRRGIQLVVEHGSFPWKAVVHRIADGHYAGEWESTLGAPFGGAIHLDAPAQPNFGLMFGTTRTRPSEGGAYVGGIVIVEASGDTERAFNAGWQRYTCAYKRLPPSRSSAGQPNLGLLAEPEARTSLLPGRTFEGDGNAGVPGDTPPPPVTTPKPSGEGGSGVGEDRPSTQATT